MHHVGSSVGRESTKKETIHDMNKQLRRERSKERNRRDQRDHSLPVNNSRGLQYSKEDTVNIGSAEILPDHSISIMVQSNTRRKKSTSPQKSRHPSEQKRSKQAKSPTKDKAIKEPDQAERKLLRVESRNSGGGLPI